MVRCHAFFIAIAWVVIVSLGSKLFSTILEMHHQNRYKLRRLLVNAYYCGAQTKIGIALYSLREFVSLFAIISLHWYAFETSMSSRLWCTCFVLGLCPRALLCSSLLIWFPKIFLLHQSHVSEALVFSIIYCSINYSQYRTA